MKMLGLNEPKTLNKIQFMEPGTGNENWFKCDKHVRKNLNQQTLILK